MKITIQRVSITILAIVEVLAILTVIKDYLFPIMEVQIHTGVSLIFLFVTQIRPRQYHRFCMMLSEIAEESQVTHELGSQESQQIRTKETKK